MGEVWRARDTRLDRTVAIKFSNAQFTDRFEREARAVAAVNHPNIAAIYDVGENYIVLEYVDGEPVRSPDSARKLLDIAVQIADGLAAAHAAGFVHRDLKPANVLITTAGRVKILDFGLAKEALAATPASEATAITDPGGIVGTIAYMSPEQAGGKALDHRSDQFSFGLILYELATGKRAFQRASTPETLTAIIREDAEPLPASVPATLRWTVERLLSKDPEDRYASTKDLFAELRGFRSRLSEASSFATIPSPPKPVRRFRSAAAWASAMAVIAAVAALAIGSRPTAPDTSGFRFTPVAVDTKDTSKPAWSPDDRSLAYYERAGNVTRIVVRDLYRGTPPVSLTQAPNSDSPLSWSPDGEQIFYGGPKVLSIARAGGQPKIVLAFDAASKKTYDLPVLSPDGKALAVLILDRSQPELVTHLAFSEPPGAEPKVAGEALPWVPSSLTWTSGGDRVVISNHTPAGDSVLSVTKDGRQRVLRQFRGAGVFEMEFSAIPNSRFLLASRIYGDDAYGLTLLDFERGDVRRLLPSQTPVTSPSVSHDGSRIAYTSRSVAFQAYEIALAGGSPHPLLPSHLSQFAVAFSPKRDEIAFTRLDQLLVYDRNSSEERTLVSGRDFPKAFFLPDLIWPAFSQAGDRVIFTCVGCEENLSLWVVPATGGTPARVIGGENGGIAASWSPDGSEIAYVRENATGQGRTPVRLRLGSGDKPQRISEDACLPSWSPAGDWILCRGAKIKLISRDGSRVRELGERSRGVAAWSNDGKLIYNTRKAGDRVLIEQVDPATGTSKTLTECLPEGPCPEGSLSVSADGKSIAFVSQAGDGDIWILDGLQLPRTLWERLWRRKP
jgi:eukaryotic-like serine/threonine-protein kinase